MTIRYVNQARKYRNDIGLIEKILLASDNKVSQENKSKILNTLKKVKGGIQEDRKNFKKNANKANVPYKLSINSKNFIRVSQMDEYLTRVVNANKRINELQVQKKVNQDEIARLMRALEKASSKTEENKLKKLLQEEKKQIAERNRTINEIQRQRQQNNIRRINEADKLRQQVSNAKVNQKAIWAGVIRA